MYTRLVNACRKGVPPGVIITGHPGIGKSEFAASRIRRMTDRPGKSYISVYVLLRRLADKQTTLFSTCESTTFLFDESGVRQKPSSTIRAFEICASELDFELGSQIWSLIDPSPKETYISMCLIYVSFFYAMFFPPDRKRYKYMLKKHAAQWIMSPWGVSELFALYVCVMITAHLKY